MKKLKVSIDLDGTAYENVDFFNGLCWALTHAGHEVGVLTGHAHTSEEKDRERLSQLGYPVMSFYLGRPPEFMHLNGAHWKSRAIVEYGIDMHFDDYDYGYDETCRLFGELGTECRVCRVTSERTYEQAMTEQAARKGQQ
jgi:hypothetical protein